MCDFFFEVIYKYVCEDVDVILKLKNILEQELKINDVEKFFYEIEMFLVFVFVYMECNGVCVDIEVLKQILEYFIVCMN